MPTKLYTVNSSDNRFKESEVSTLANAAKISHIVNETTIGKTLRIQKPDIVPPESKSNNVQRQQSADPWKRDVWHSVDLDNERRRYSGNTFNLMDCKAIQMKMALKTAERMRQKQVRMEIAQRQVKFNELEEMMNNLKIDLIQKSATKLQKNLLMKEEQILRAVQQLETNARLAEEQANREIEEQSKKMAEKINRLKRVEEVRGYFQSIKSMKDLFIILFEKFVKTCISNQQHLKKFEQYTQARESYLTRYESIINTVNLGTLSSTEIDMLEKICDDIKEMQRSVEEEIKAGEELDQAIADRNERLRLEEEQTRKENDRINNEQLSLQLKQQHHHQPQQPQPVDQEQRQQVDATDASNIINVVSNLNRFVSNEKLSHYQTTMKFYEEYAQSVKPLQNDDAMKRFRFDCQKGVNTLVNAISAATSNHLQDKFDKLALILSGNGVKFGSFQLVTSQHPLGIRFVNLLVAKKFVSQADTAISSHPIAAFPIASLIVAIWQKFPDFGTLFLAYFYKQCPYLVPYFIPHVEGQSSEEYLKSVGFHFTDNVCEEHVKFLKRLSGLVRLYSSVIISKSRRTINKPHPHGIENAWIWLTNVLNLDPLPDVSATMIYEFLLTTGADLWRTYGKQFLKILQLLQGPYMVRLNQVDVSGGPKTRLEGLLRKIISEQRIEEPEALPSNFW